jgi:hypothetical protein
MKGSMVEPKKSSRGYIVKEKKSWNDKWKASQKDKQKPQEKYKKQ